MGFSTVSLSAVPRTGVITVEDLLRSPALQLRLIAGEAGVSRRVAWAHVSELEDPTPWLAGAELIMTTGMALARADRPQRAYLERLDDAGVACLALSEGLFVPPLTRDFLAAADERSFPVVEVPIPVPFMAIAQEVAAAVQGDTAQRLNAQLQVFGAVQWLAAGNLTDREIFARLERLSGYTLYACTLQRTRLLDGVPVPPPDHVGLIPGTSTSPPTVAGGYVLPVTGPRGTAGYILAMETPGAAPAGVSVVQHIATVAALQLSMRAHEREMLRREGAETLAEMLQGVLDRAVVARRLAASGFTAGHVLLLAIVRPGPEAGDDSVADALAEAGVPHLILRQQDELFVLVEDDERARSALAGPAAAAAGPEPAVQRGHPARGGPAGGAVGAGPGRRGRPGRGQLRRRPDRALADRRIRRPARAGRPGSRPGAELRRGALGRPGLVGADLAGARPADRAGRGGAAHPPQHAAVPGAAVRADQRAVAGLD